jgi:hypothetical protein
MMGRIARALARTLFLAAVPSLLAACGGTGSGKDVSDVSAIYALPASLDELSQETFFDHPWPSDMRLEGGSPRFTGYPNPKGFPLLDQYAEATRGALDGFSPAGAGYLRFTGEIDETTLPGTPKDALDPASSVQLVDIDDASPEHLSRKLISIRWQAAAGVYYQPNTLAWMPTIGFPLRPHTRYALVVTDKLQAKSGGAIAQQADLAKVVGVEPADAKTRLPRAELAPAVADLETAGIPRSSIVHLAVFTTADPTKELEIIRDALPSLIPAPTVEASQWSKTNQGTFTEFKGRYGPSPNFQAGDLPFQVYGDGGNFVFEDGVPVLQSTFDLRFSLSVPNKSLCPMPQAGYPIVLYGHGTGGSYRSYLNGGTAEKLAAQCIASMGIDQIFHGDRPGAPMNADDSSVEILFFNFQNPVAARTNGRQAAIDEMQRVRLFTESHITIPANLSPSGAEIRFDPTKIMYFGHSQGGLNGPLFTAVDPSVRGAVFSGAGAEIGIALLEKTLPTPSVSSLVKTLLLGLNGDEAAELDIFHPALSLAQSMVDTVDPLHYGRLQQLEPRPGFAPKSIYMSEGVNPDGTGDSYAPPHGIEAHGLSMGLPLQLPAERPAVEMQWGGPDGVTIPPGGLAGNLGSGKASGVLAQWAVPQGSDGHFVIFDVPQAEAQSITFLRQLADDPVGRVPAP